ncbi:MULTISPECIES: Na(+)/H(+) antiporter subunit F1 [Nosocomiicoccus]|uniref:Na(+)/H(+) antiporter subunit F1 n=1 Tax=Nosocomiicoccus massiliensis TaxID=1232430 RepID=A0AAF0YI92_9STAP|nr:MULTISPECIES: Na(+)/H(+) antiporter subunit F1 [Nosocomiicoccus]MDK6863780.1 Na(+)/H(+) antiporter subunit F1 [Nosocomiicoccus ampullae]OFL49151.1 cation:proton antiporter [Nosocomiicoccus sp. HMSC067E10]OFO52739.1 cation:proton antiporter [Nosocomiicoccus sp. HMSC059G07]OFS62663.1 cation:proton antiporter [Nosocomiicoccus sp. HMSC09A07]WOS96071.1 Na(+)/H(+) antiporter subunit F1 [Nosocomiicoccus massiliensis]
MISFLQVIFIIAIIGMAVALVIASYRIIKGPTLHDKIVALDAFGVMLMGTIGIFSVLLDTPYLIVVIMIIGMLGAVGTIAMAKFLEKGWVIDHDRDPDD